MSLSSPQSPHLYNGASIVLQADDAQDPFQLGHHQPLNPLGGGDGEHPASKWGPSPADNLHHNPESTLMPQDKGSQLRGVSHLLAPIDEKSVLLAPGPTRGTGRQKLKIPEFKYIKCDNIAYQDPADPLT